MIQTKIDQNRDFAQFFHRELEARLVVISFLCIMLIVKEQQCTNFDTILLFYYTDINVILYLDIYVY